jgi:alkylglycerol monooxygenase
VTPSGWVLLAIAAVAAAVDWWAVWAETPRARLAERVAKPTALLALIGVAVVARPATPSVEPWLLLALLGSLAGDVLLLPPGRLVPGLVAFLLAHVAYIAALSQLPSSPAGLALGVVVGLVVVASVGRRLVRAASRQGMGVPVAAYLGVISLMAVAATGTLLPTAALGAWLFVGSDSMLGWGEFVVAGGPDGRSRGGQRLRLAVIATYHLAQALLVVTLVTA